MTKLTSTVLFKKTVLASFISLCVSQSVFALQEISDDALSETTGEGIALLPENFSFRFNGADNANNGAGTYGAGSIRLIPVGPLSATATAKGYKKADAWLYGLSLSQSSKNLGAAIDGSDWGNLYGRPIDSWGTADNPWVLTTLNDQNVPNFAGTISNVTYLALEAPLRKMVLPAAGTAESSAYNLKLGLWTDIFQRDATVAENGLNGLSNRLRLAAVWDGFSINGSNLKVFQTLDGVTPSMGGTYNATLKINNVPTVKTFNYGMNTNYNKTFGVAGLVRLNSGATDTKRGTVSNQTTTREIVQMNYDPATKTFSEGAVLATTNGTMTSATANETNNSNGIQISYTPMTNGGLDPYNKFYSGSFSNGGVCTTPQGNTTGGDGQFGQCLNQNGFTTRRLRVKGTNDWTAPTATSVFRISTQEIAGGTYDNSTPALGGAVPNFRPNGNADGIFLYDMNVNLVLGNLYQPLMLSTDGNNFSIELARIPNAQEVYRRIYTRYENIDPAASVDPGVTYLGSTCNIYQCGTSTVAGYQGSSATHSSITIGATDYDPATNRLSAHKGIGSYGVSIGELKSGTGLASSTQEDFTQVWQRSRGTTTQSCGFLCTETIWGGWGAWGAVAPKAPVTGQPHPSLNRPNPYETTWRQNYNNQILGIQTTTPTDIAGRINNMQPPGATVNNNFGSAAIDGLLIQHLKLTTTGL
ncbi:MULTISPECIES: hypothetical protein [Acinetobacter]|uniref:hypothetical protein n=1 Tax=Acinetobacter courvalinii TaxID=280147 RepID=UPI0021CF6359|nr:hypothetical protein [Acinetobacter courvalinii]MCU4368772.1 hypothetical protein [Acinetobacter courvalinii]MCU4446976.1 hypothetical protein [Acinetobacter courvalinii]